MCISVDAPTDGVVTLLQANYNGWNVYVDGKKANIVEVDGCFLGVGVTKGKHTIEFSFCPKDFYFGLIISVVYISGNSACNFLRTPTLKNVETPS